MTMDRAHGDEDTVVESLNHTEKEKKKKKNPQCSVNIYRH